MTDFSKVKANMEGYGFKVSVFDTKEEACAFLAEELEGKSAMTRCTPKCI